MEEIEYEEWFSSFYSAVRRLHYIGPLEQNAFLEDFEKGKTPEEAAEEWMKAIQSNIQSRY